jgi:hypothetical protein
VVEHLPSLLSLYKLLGSLDEWKIPCLEEGSSKAHFLSPWFWWAKMILPCFNCHLSHQDPLSLSLYSHFPHGGRKWFSFSFSFSVLSHFYPVILNFCPHKVYYYFYYIFCILLEFFSCQTQEPRYLSVLFFWQQCFSLINTPQNILKLWLITRIMAVVYFDSFCQ